MPHMVIFRTNEGKAGYHPTETLDDAVRFVEHLRNNEQVAESKVYRLHEVPIEFKVMYKVEVAGSPSPAAADDGGTADAVRAAEPGGGAVPPAPPAPPARSLSGTPDPSEPLRATAAPGPTGTGAPSPVSQTGGRFGLFSRT